MAVEEAVRYGFPHRIWWGGDGKRVLAATIGESSCREYKSALPRERNELSLEESRTVPDARATAGLVGSGIRDGAGAGIHFT